MENTIKFNYINVISETEHENVITIEKLKKYSENFTKPVLLKGLVEIDKKLLTRNFYEEIDKNENLQWRVKDSKTKVTMRGENGESDYNYVTGKVGSGREFLDDIYINKLDVYSHLGTISSGFKDEYQWGKTAFNKVKKEIFKKNWLNIPNWSITGHMFFGHSNEEFGEPKNGAVGSDWHMFPTLNIFVMISGQKKWYTRPPGKGDQFKDYDKLFSTSSGRENSGGNYNSDIVYVDSGDVLFNLPFEWHKVLNNKGLSIGAAFRVIDNTYIDELLLRKNADPVISEELAHFMTSLSYSSHHINRAQMMLNDLEFSYIKPSKNHE